MIAYIRETQACRNTDDPASCSHQSAFRDAKAVASFQHSRALHAEFGNFDAVGVVAEIVPNSVINLHGLFQVRAVIAGHSVGKFNYCWMVAVNANSGLQIGLEILDGCRFTHGAASFFIRAFI